MQSADRSIVIGFRSFAMCQVDEWLLDCLDLEEEGTTFLQNVGKLQRHIAEHKNLALYRWENLKPSADRSITTVLHLDIKYNM
jgi:hypothetical protein